MRFSEKHGFKPVRSVVQAESSDEPLRNALWTAIHEGALGTLKDHYYDLDNDISLFLDRLWVNHYKEPIDTRPTTGGHFHVLIRESVFNGPWYELYDLIAFILENFPFWPETERDEFKDLCNHYLQREMSAWRIVGSEISRLTSEEEISAIEEALTPIGQQDAVGTHLATALKHLSNRESPDYRNSIKESISAVEAICRIITGKQKATLGKALDQLAAAGVNVHPALKDAFDKLYGYSSDADGIRHSLLRETTLDYEDAKFMLVSCSAFVNLLRARTGA
jgi:AbiJ N-terminal domain 4